MCTRTFTLIFVMRLPTVCFGNTLSHAEATCSELGFKRKTEAFGDCVLELHSRNKKTVKQSGDGSPDDNSCKKFGFVVGTQEYASCRLQMDTARQQAQQKQAEYELAKQQYEQELRVYEERLAAYEKEKKRRQGDAMMKFGLALMGGTSPHFSENLANAGRASLGYPPVQPAIPRFDNFMITTPSGQITNCNVSGNLIHCF
jgi:hypothetical protein